MPSTHTQSAGYGESASRKRGPFRRYWWAVVAGVLVQFALLPFMMWSVMEISVPGFYHLFEVDMVRMERPTVSEMAGTYHLSNPAGSALRESSFPWAKRYGSAPLSTIDLRADGTLMVVNLPDIAVTGWDYTDLEFLSGEGRWEVRENAGGWGYLLDTEIAQGDVHPYSVSPWIVIRGAEKPYYLEIIIGDPDNGERITYSRD